MPAKTQVPSGRIARLSPDEPFTSFQSPKNSKPESLSTAVGSAFAGALSDSAVWVAHPPKTNVAPKINAIPSLSITVNLRGKALIRPVGDTVADFVRPWMHIPATQRGR